MNTRTVIGGERRGFALLTIIMLTLAMAALAASAVYLAGNAGLIGTSVDREREFKYGAEAAMAIGKSRLNTDALALPDTGFSTLMSGQQVMGADGAYLPGVTVNMYVGPTGSTTGQFGRFASVVAEARDQTGARFVRRLELTQESFARFAYWSNQEKDVNGGTIYFGGGDNLWGPVWSNDIISIASSKAWFHGDVGTAKTISGANYGTFDKGYTTGQPAITLPTNGSLVKLAGYAASGSTAFNAPAPADLGPDLVRIRLEFVSVDLGQGGLGPDEGFVRVYYSPVTNTERSLALGGNGWLRGDWTGNKATSRTCGASYKVAVGGPLKFFPASVHGQAWMNAMLVTGGLTAAQATAVGNQTLNQIMAQPTARCYLGGDPHLVAEERNGTPVAPAPQVAFTAAQKQVAGDTTTFTPIGVHGQWVKWLGPIDPRVALARPWDANYLFPLYRGLNPGTKGVITVNGTTGISGVLRGKVTVYATGDIIVLDDQIYATNPSVNNPNAPGSCPDMLGLISGNNITVADNALSDPPNIAAGGPAPSPYRNEDDTQDLNIQGVMMALNTSFGVENYDTGPSSATGCQGAGNNGRGCLFLYGGLIQQRRGAVGLLSGEGYIKRYTYDRCAVSSPPPYFPTTGRYLDNRYYEIDPVRFNIQALFAGLTPN